MTPKAQKMTPNIRLKLAIVASQKKQRVIAARARLHEVRLSKIVTGREEATPKEQERLAKVLHCAESDLFPQEVAAIS